MPTKSLWNIKPRPRVTGNWNLYYGQDYIARFNDEDVARRVLVLLITAGDKMEVIPPILADDPSRLKFVESKGEEHGSALKSKCKFDEHGYLTELPQACSGVYFLKRPEVFHRDGDYYVVKIKGHEAWSGAGTTKYYAARYKLLKVTMLENVVEFIILRDESVENRNWRDVRLNICMEASHRDAYDKST